MPDAYDRLRKLQTLRAGSARYLVTPVSSQAIPSGPTPASPLPSSVIATNSQTFAMASGGYVRRYSGPLAGVNGWVNIPPPAPWPPAGDFGVGVISGPPYQVLIQKTYNSVTGQAMYTVDVGLLRFDTTALPDTAVIATATLRIYATAYNLPTPDRSLTFEWQAWTNTSADWTATEGTSAQSGVPLKSLPYSSSSWIEIPLKDPAANISKTGSTYLKAHISGGDPLGATSPYGNAAIEYGVTFLGGGTTPYSQTGGPEYAPQLVVGYS